MNFDQDLKRYKTDSMKWNKYPADVIPLWIADMDFESDKAIGKRLVELAELGIFGYNNTPKELIEVVVDRMKTRHNWEIKPEWIVVLPGLVPGLHASSRIFGDEKVSIMTSSPVYKPFLESASMGNSNLQSIPFVWQNNQWEMDFEAMEKQVKENTKMYMLCNPHNPNGRVFSEAELQKLSDFCLKHNLFLCSDEIHCDLILDENKKHISIASLNKDLENQTITLIAPSKTFNIAGLGCSFAIISNAEIRAKFQKAIYGILCHATSFAMEAALVAYRECEPWREAVIKYLKANHDYLMEEINQIEGLEMKPLEATYLAWINYEKTGRTDMVELLEKNGVGVQDAAHFGGKGYIRLNFATQKANLIEAVARIKKALK